MYKQNIITYLQQHRFQYLNVANLNVNRTDNEKTIEDKLIQCYQHLRILCSSDTLTKNNFQEFQKRINYLKEELSKNSNLHLIYADFTDSSFPLSTILVLPSLKQTHNDITDYPSSRFTAAATISLEHQKSILQSVNTTDPSIFSTLQSTPSVNTINILLLGETGVGKSTFINAFVNYLKFGSLEKARTGKPIVIISVSFIATVGDHFEERIVKFDDINNSNNEDFDHPGESVTQRCKSYLFHLDKTSTNILRIIDTPGFGDTRGLEQDDFNMQHILEYISNLTHLNAICFLLKPNTSRLNIFFHTCITQLFSLLDRNALNNIIFCFTNSRSTFYTPGDTAPVLKQTLISLSIGDVPFKKDNTFCFDSESFRYLVALQNGIPFNDDEKHEYEISWSTSVNESNRLIGYICRNVTIYRIDNKLQSMKRAQFEISDMVRPILETLRNILRNYILYKMNLLRTSILLCPRVNDQFFTRCLVCKPSIHSLGDFYIAHYLPHKVEKKCCNCTCLLDQHIPMYYVPEYKILNDVSQYTEKEMINRLYELCYASAEFAYFLLYDARSTKDNPFFIGFIEMIAIETEICKNQTSSTLNSSLATALRDIADKHENRLNDIVRWAKSSNLSDIYNLINTISNYDMVCEQLAAVKEGRKIMMKQYEYEFIRI
ncbi:unnamed protein product [Rotaria sp. Silwood2]|nr:unnamed protein product [Rotaria sp. Silwood2]